MPEPQHMHSARVLVDSINDQITMHEYKPNTGTLCDKSASFGKFTQRVGCAQQFETKVSDAAGLSRAM
jgi:hypothetical protein